MSSVQSAEPRRYKAAGFWRRLLAGLLDGMVLVPFWGLCFVAVYFLVYRTLPSLRQLTPDLWVAFLVEREQVVGKALLVWMVISGLFYATVLHAFWGQTLGKKCLGIRVVDRYGQRLGLLHAAARAGSSLVSLLLCGAGFLWCAFDVQRQAWHDRITGTHVVRDR